MFVVNMIVVLVERGVDVVVLGWFVFGNGDGIGLLGRGECVFGFVVVKWEIVRFVGVLGFEVIWFIFVGSLLGRVGGWWGVRVDFRLVG